LFDLHRQVDELFEKLVYRPWAISARSGWRPPLDLHETADAYLVVIDLPDVNPEEVHVFVGERELVVSGQRLTADSAGTLLQRCERPCGPFERTLSLPQAVDPGQARAEFRHGTCRIRLPKKVRPGRAAPAVLAVEVDRSITPFPR
jgi:HSP20 family protein